MPRHRPDAELTATELAVRQYHREYRAAHREHLDDLHRAYYAEHRDELLAQARESYGLDSAAKREYAKQYRRKYKDRLKAYWRERKTGCSPELYAKLLAEQGGVCAICGGVDERELCADHDHETGKVRGLLCRLCNLGIGKLRHSVVILEQAIAYLQR